MIDLEKFTKEKEIIVPITNESFQYNRKKYKNNTNKNIEDGWFKVIILGNNFDIIEEVSMETENLRLPVIKGYSFNNNIIFQNFDVGLKKTGKDVMTKLFLNKSASFSSLEAVIWEDKRLYYYRPNYNDFLIYDVKQKYDEEKSITDLKGITPELKTLFLFHDLERIKIKEEIKKMQLKKQIEEFNNSLPGRLSISFARVGAKILNYTITNKRIIVDWEIIKSGTKFNSVIDLETFRIIEAGYCMSGDDKKHNIHSMVITAKDYEDDDELYITRD